ncbi:MAG: acyl-CoA thioesterase [Glaciimonas sp.]|nr:acyl-CoA thioesterase [Glaciimonas sp.]
MMHKKLVHTTRIAIRWGDMDAMGHVNNTVYFRYLEQARIEWLTAIGCAPDPTAEGPVIVNAHCSFNKQLKYPGEIEILTYVGPPGRSSFETIQEIRRVDSADIIYAHGGAKVVWVHFPSEKSTPLPERVRQLLSD